MIISNRVSIECRPKDSDSGERSGEREVDTVLGKQNTGVIVSLVERNRKLYLIKKVGEAVDDQY